MMMLFAYASIKISNWLRLPQNKLYLLNNSERWTATMLFGKQSQINKSKNTNKGP